MSEPIPADDHDPTDDSEGIEGCIIREFRKSDGNGRTLYTLRSYYFPDVIPWYPDDGAEVTP